MRVGFSRMKRIVKDEELINESDVREALKTSAYFFGGMLFGRAARRYISRRATSGETYKAGIETEVREVTTDEESHI